MQGRQRTEREESGIIKRNEPTARASPHVRLLLVLVLVACKSHRLWIIGEREEKDWSEAAGSEHKLSSAGMC